MIQKEIDRIKGNPAVLESYRSGMNSLFQAGIVDALRVLGRPKRYANGQSHIVMASEGAWSAGWNDCLEALLYFEQLYLTDGTAVPNVRMDFGSLTRAVANGELNQEEADAIRRGDTPKYKQSDYTSNITIPTKPS